MELINFTDPAYFDYYDYNGSILPILQHYDTEAPDHVVYAIILCVVSIILNVVISLIIVTSSSLRQRILYIQIANFCLANIITSVFVIPISVYAEKGPWGLGNTVCKAWIIMDVLLPFIAITILLLMNLDRLFFLSCSRFYSCINKKFIYFLLMMLPWFVGILTVLPLWLIGGKDYDYPGYCAFGLNKYAAITLPIITYFLPGIGIIVIITLILIFSVKNGLVESHSTTSQTAEYSNTRPTPTTSIDEEKNVSLFTLCLADFFFVAMWFPHQLISLLMSVCDACHPPVRALVGFTWLGASTTFVVQLAWLSDINIRHDIVVIVRKSVFNIRSCIISVTRICFPRKPQEATYTERNTVPLINM